MASTPPSVLLPANVVPKKYTVQLEPHFEDFTFFGTVSIELDVVEPTKEIHFHAHKIKISNAILESGERKLEAGKVTVPAVTLDESAERAVFSLGPEESELAPGPAVLFLEYTGLLNNDMIGFYRASYVLDGETRYMATTQFEPAGARQALPCWDEPAHKAVFSVSLVVPKGMQGLSNMPEVSSEAKEGGATLVKFADSPKMSTYLLAFVVGDLEKISGKTVEGTEVNVYTTPGKKVQGEFALDVACKILTFFTEYFGIAYPLPKSDLIAVPDFAMGAMENWGLITFRETALLVDKANAPARTLQHVAYVVSHELAHQWFGNLVTMKWWTDLWLNEGFATWVGHLGVDHVHPEWDTWTQFVTDDLDVAMRTDALLKSHPIEVPINDPKEIEQVFDALSYYKGASVIRQLVAAIGSDAFKKGLNTYLDRHKYSNTITNDLWAALEESSGKGVKAMMDSWTTQMGYPLITVSNPPGGGPGLHLRQSRFLSKGPPTPEEDDKLWYVGVCATTGTPGSKDIQTLKTFPLSTKEATAEHFVVPEGGWIRLNAGNTGIFRVNYTPPLWEALATAVATMSLPVIDRLGLAMDVFALAKAGIVPTTQALDMAFSFKEETEFAVWSSLAGDLAEIDILVSALGERPALEKAGLLLFRPIAEKLGWEAKEGESHMDAMLRPLVLGRLGSFKDEPTVAKCQESFKAMQADMQDGRTIPPGLVPLSGADRGDCRRVLALGKAVAPDLRRFVIGTAVKYGGREELHAARKMYEEATLADFKVHCLVAMSQTSQQDLFKEYLDWAMDEAHVKAQDQLFVFRMMATNPENRDFAWEYFKEHFEAIHARFQPSPALFSKIPACPLKEFATEEKAEEAEEFFTANPVPEATMDLQRTLESVRSRAQWLKRDGASIVAWLKAKAS